MQLNDIAAELTNQFADTITCILEHQELTIEVVSTDLLVLCEQLKAKPYYFEQLVDLTGVDYLQYAENKATPRFAVVYHLLSYKNNLRLRIKSYCDLAESMPSVVNIWLSANWYEREAFDLFGIIFTGHPKLTRILMDDDFIGHPLRKDFPLMGNLEVYYDKVLQQVKRKPVEIATRTLNCE